MEVFLIQLAWVILVGLVVVGGPVLLVAYRRFTRRRAQSQRASQDRSMAQAEIRLGLVRRTKRD